MQIYFNKDCDRSLIQSKKVGFIGYGSQGRAHALNLKDSGVQQIRVALYEGSKTSIQVVKDGFILENIETLSKWADIIVFALPDEKQAEIYEQFVMPNIRDGAAFCFIHGLNIHFGLIKPKPSIDVFMVAPKGPGYAVRDEYLSGRGTICLIAIAQNESKQAKNIAFSYSSALGCGNAGIFETSFKDECIGDLFGEQAVLCGGLTELIRSGYEVLIENGIDPHIAYLECVHEVKLVVDLIYKNGIASMNRSISNTAEWGEYIAGPKVIDDEVKKNMQQIFLNINSGIFVKNWIKEYKTGMKNMQKIRNDNEKKTIEKVGAKIRAILPWLS